jgi:hypothetical protein
MNIERTSLVNGNGGVGLICGWFNDGDKVERLLGLVEGELYPREGGQGLLPSILPD